MTELGQAPLRPGLASLLLALALSVLLHALLLSGITLPDAAEDDLPPPLQARLALPVAAPAPAPPPPPPLAPRRAARPAPHPVATPAATPADLSPPPAQVPETAVPPEPTVAPPPEAASVPEPAPPVAPPPGAQEAPPPLPPVATALPAQAQIEFAVIRDGAEIGRARYDWSQDGHRYRMVIVLETTGLASWIKPVRVTQSSTGQFSSPGLEPEQYRSNRGDDTEARESARFDWNTNRVMLAHSKGQREADLLPGAQDFASVWLQLSWLTARQSGEPLRLQVATGKRLKLRQFRREDERTVDTRVGTLACEKWSSPGSADEDGIEVWLAREHRRLPVRIRYTDRKGQVFDQLARTLEYDQVRLVELPKTSDTLY